MGRVRRCDSRCHRAKGNRCRCWCSGFFHGKDSTGAVNRQALAGAIEQRIFLEQHGFTEGATAYIEQKELPLEVASEQAL